MIVNGLELPSNFVEAVKNGTLQQVWQLREDKDAYGNPLQTDLGDIHKDEDALVHESEKVRLGFPPDPAMLVTTPEEEAEPGYIPYITDFSKILCFATSGGGEDFCFDYRDNPKEPSVIYWDDTYWRRLAPNFTQFLALFDSNKCRG